MNKLSYQVEPGGTLVGTLRVPGDKSISHRAIMLAAIAEGNTEITGFLESHDALATLNAFKAMGVDIAGPNQGHVRVQGVGKYGLAPPGQTLDCGNSGTTMRLLTGLLAAQPFATTLDGDASLRRRPMQRVVAPLTQMGAKIHTGPTGLPPIHISPVSQLQGIEYHLPIASAQVKSALLLAGLYAETDTIIIEPAPSRDHTERMLLAFGAELSVTPSRIHLRAHSRLTGANLPVPADLSSAAFFLVGATIAPGSDILLTDVGLNPTRTGIINILTSMGANIEILATRHLGAEPVADLRVRYAPLHGITIPPELVPLAIDEFPAIFIAAANASGETVLTQAAELRVKESDRLKVMAEGLTELGARATLLEDGIRIQGSPYHGGTINSAGDHRIAMAFAIAALTASGPITINDCYAVATSFPGFIELAQQAGLLIQASNH